MSEAYLPVAVPDKYRGRWTDSAHLRWLGWLLEFQRLDLSRLTGKQQRGLHDDIVKFCSAYPFGLQAKTGALRAERVEKLSVSAVRRDVQQIQKQLRQGVQSLIVGERVLLVDPKDILPAVFKESSEWDTHKTQLWCLPINTLALCLWRAPEYKSSRGDKPRRFKTGAVEYFLQADWPDIFWLAVADLLRTYGDRLRQCQKVECGKVFIRSKRQDYCSSNCSQSARSKKWYALNRPKAKRNRQARYEKHMKKHYGPNIKVTHPVKRKESDQG